MSAGWHPAIAYALLGRVPAGLANPPEPDLSGLLEELHRRAPTELKRLRDAGPPEPWPHPVPAELRTGLGYAQLAALIERARRMVTADEPPHRVITSRPYTAEERRLATDVPPHHGS